MACTWCGTIGPLNERCDCEQGRKPAPPEVPAPDEVWVLVDEKGELDRSYKTAPTQPVRTPYGQPGAWVRYVRAREGGR